MKFLWVNNVCSLLGGTLNCTLSMVRAFPDAEHTVFGFGGRFGESEYEVFPDNVKLVSSSNLSDFVKDKKFDIVVFQNTQAELIPRVYLNKPLTVYYLHSHHRTAHQAIKKCDTHFCVSKYLADIAGLPHEKVLYQPVTVPSNIVDAEYLEWSKHFRVVVGRICTPNPRKWVKEELDSLYHLFFSKVGYDEVGFHFVGATDPVEKMLSKYGNCFFSKPSFKARGYLKHWSYLLYKSSQTETYGRVVKEAQRSRCIPIVSNHSGFREQIEQGVTGYLCDTDEEFEESLSKDINQQTIQLFDMSDRAKTTGGVNMFRREFLRRLADYCSL